MTTVYRRTDSFDHEEFEDELVLMEIESQAVVTLNATGQMVWDALEGGATLEEIGDLFQRGFSDADPEAVRRDIQGVLDTLLTAGLASADAAKS